MELRKSSLGTKKSKKNNKNKKTVSTSSSAHEAMTFVSLFSSDEYPILSVGNIPSVAQRDSMVTYLCGGLPLTTRTRWITCDPDLDHYEIQKGQNMRMKSMFVGQIYKKLMSYGIDALSGQLMNTHKDKDSRICRMTSITKGLNVERHTLMQHELLSIDQKCFAADNPDSSRQGGFVAIFRSQAALEPLFRAGETYLGCLWWTFKDTVG